MMGLNAWPRLDDVDLMPTISTLQLWTQVVGKVRLMLTPWENHGWHVPFYLSPRGFATGLISIPGTALTVAFDLRAAELVVETSRGDARRLPLGPGPLADSTRSLLGTLRELGIRVAIDPLSSELPDPVRLDEDAEQRPFDPEIARRYWQVLVEVHRVFQLFRTRFTGKVSPIHLFWGAFDLVVTRFSGRPAPPHPGGAPFLNDAVMREAYSHEVSSAGFWPNLGGAAGPCFYSYAYPVPEGYAQREVRPSAVRYDAALGEFVLPYADVVASSDPDAAVLDFLQTTYDATADLAGWDRPLLECEQGLLGKPPKGS